MRDSVLKTRPTSLTGSKRMTRQLRLVGSESYRQPKAILVCDAISQAEQWRVALALGESEMVSVTDAAEASLCEPALVAVIDVAAEKLVEILHALRMNSEQSGLHILVAADRIANAPQLAGVLPRFRAMACGLNELLHLARRRLVHTTPLPRKDVML